ncbi:MAG: TAXI family TRAP transporter solute-binding subunit [Alphaproteobacteria bacterium]
MRKLFLGIAGALALAAGSAGAQPYNLTLTGASPGGLWSLIGAGVDAAVAAAYPGSTITYQTSSGGLANVPLVAGGKVPLGIAADMELMAAVKGREPFKSPIGNVRVLVRTYAPSARFQMTHLLLNKAFADKHGIKEFSDIVRKKAPVRVAINRPGNMSGDMSAMIMAEMGATLKDIDSWGGQVVRAASREMTSLMLDRRIDMVVLAVSYNHRSIRKMAKGITPVLLDVPRPVAQKVADTMGVQVCGIKAGEYKFLDRDVTTVCAGTVILVNEKMDQRTAYNLTKGILKNIDKFKAAHRLLKKFVTPQMMAEPGVAPFHPGAAKYLREAGLLK